MTLVVTISELSDTDFDGNPVTVKQAMCSIDGTPVKQAFTYGVLVTDAVIIADVRTNLAARGYQFD